MSPRRKVDAEEVDYFQPPVVVVLKPPRSVAMTVVGSLVAMLLVLAIAGASLMLVSNVRDHRTLARDTNALGYVKEFMTAYTTLDPFHANEYGDRILSQGTGEFAKGFKEKFNEILVQVARAEPTTGSVLEAGVQRWNNDTSADVLVATKVTTKAPDGKSTIESGNRWVVTTTLEGQQWKISNLIQVI